jgi:hypothetical protein
VRVIMLNVVLTTCVIRTTCFWSWNVNRHWLLKED